MEADKKIIDRRGFLSLAMAGALEGCGGGGSPASADLASGPATPVATTPPSMPEDTVKDIPLPPASTPVPTSTPAPTVAPTLDEPVNNPTISAIYLDKQSYLPADVAKMYVNAGSAATATLRLLDVNNQEVFRIVASVQPQSVTNAEPWRDGFGYLNPIEFQVPDIASGVYFWEGIGRMIIRSSKKSDIFVLYPSNTECAYNASGGKSFYYPAPPNHGSVLSFLRPWDSSTYFKCVSFYQWLAGKTSYSANHISDYDLETPDLLSLAKLLIVVGHSEYWSRAARNAFDHHVNSGGNALILSGDTMWWQIRYSADGEQLICYKDYSDPIGDPLLKTVLWTTPTLTYPITASIGADFDRGGYGLNADAGWNGMKIVRPDSSIFSGLTVSAGDILQIPSQEYDGAPIKSFDADGTPVLDKTALGFLKADIIGFDLGYRIRPTVGTWLAFQKNANSGIVINCATTDWCSANGMGGKDGAKIAVITRNMIDLLLAGTYPV